LAAAQLLSGCASSGKITKVEVCAEIPFLDGAEGACHTTVVNTNRLVSKDEWAKERPYMLMIHAKYWTEIKKDWLRGCRLAGPDCNVQVESVDSVIQALDKILKGVK
jgi:hypothetical protein